MSTAPGTVATLGHGCFSPWQVSSAVCLHICWTLPAASLPEMQEAFSSTCMFSVHTHIHGRTHVYVLKKGCSSDGFTTKGVDSKASERKVTIPLENGHGGGGGSSCIRPQRCCNMHASMKLAQPLFLHLYMRKDQTPAVPVSNTGSLGNNRGSEACTRPWS